MTTSLHNPNDLRVSVSEMMSSEILITKRALKPGSLLVPCDANEQHLALRNTHVLYNLISRELAVRSNALAGDVPRLTSAGSVAGEL